MSAKAEELKRLGVDVLAVSVDESDEEEKVRRFAGELNIPFAILLGNDEVIPTYSTINRFLFNRRRDLGVPTSFLVNESGMIVKTYVGAATPTNYAETIVEVDEAYKGQASPSVRIVQLGGVVGNVRMTVHGALHWHPGEEVLLFLEPYRNEGFQASVE